MNTVFRGAGFFLLALGLAACGSSSPPAKPRGTTSTARCAEPLPAAVRDATVTVDVPTDFDPTSNPASATTVPFTVLMPQRCPDERFPLVLYGHGFGGKRIRSIDDGLIDDDHVKPLLDRGYIVISFDERGHGDNRPAQGGGHARLMDPRAETQDARAILDWAYDHAADIAVQTEPGSGIARDLKVGTLGGSYGGGFQMLLAALDPRIDVIAADRTWHDLLYSLLPGDAVKTWLRLFSLLIQLDDVAPGQGVTATPLARTAASQVGPLTPGAERIRTRADLAAAMAAPTAQPRPVSEPELDDFVYTHGMDYFESRETAGQPWGFGEARARLRPVPALFTQGQRDVLFNATEAYWNARYFAAPGADVRVLTHEDGHMNPLAGQARGAWACGGVEVQTAILAWFDRYLKSTETAEFRAIPKVCISVLDSSDAAAAPVGVALSEFPVGSLSGVGAVPAMLPTLSIPVPATTSPDGVFVPIATITGNDMVLAGIPRIGRLTVAPGTGSLQTAIALVGVGLRRAGAVHLVNDQVTAFVAGEHDSNRGVAHAGEGVLLPGVGHQLQDGDEVGLIFFQHHRQYAHVVSAQNAGGATSITALFPGAPALPPVLSALDPVAGMLAVPNPYEVTAENVELPVLVPGQYPQSRWSR